MKKIIEVKALKKTFGKGKNKVHAVQGISFDIYDQEIFGFLGPNGAGKTTSLRMIVGLLRPDAGEVTILGKNPHKKDKSLKNVLGIIPQTPTFYEDLTVEENLWFLAKIYDIPKKLAKERIDSLISQIGLEEKRKTIIKNLSGGQKRRLNLILALVHDPKIVLCDEPTPGLDPQSRVAVWDFIRNLPNQGKTVILTTHYMEEADKLSNRVAIIDNGKILVLDTPKKLKSSIGEGDLVEIELAGQPREKKLKPLAAKLAALEPPLPIEDITISQNSLTIRALDLIPKLSRILAFIEKQNFKVGNLSLRGTTLEDVFINLTGRRLRS
ncbi:multidrug ABC transporter ATP-binding protein [Candidatus Heimdallarchaeota archaeon B3_Heim]|nr:MAG: multidrug ABC transporter ATP-binding protein [Candidatus Heimdallarchaeota archaeon B3_Heim]